MKSKVEKIKEKKMIDFGSYLKQKRTEAGLTQLEIAEKCGFGNAQFISNIERGLCWPTMQSLRVMSELYSVPPQEILYLLMDAKKEIWSSELGISKKKA